MGTNFYVKQEACSCCGHEPERVHLGKSSAGWVFLFRWNPKLYSSWDQLRVWLLDKQIVDEYNEIVPYGDFVYRVEKKQNNPTNLTHRVRDPSVIVVDGYEFYDRDFS